MLNRKRNFQVRVCLDKILRIHQNYRHFNEKMDLLFRRYSNFLDAPNETETDKMKSMYLEFLRGQFILRCSICAMKIENISVICRKCLHGGHLDHLNEWFLKEKYCPKCFECQWVNYIFNLNSENKDYLLYMNGLVMFV